MQFKIFGREPAAFIALLGSVLVVLAAMNLSWLNAGQAAAGTAVIAAIVLAWTTRPVAPALLTGAFSALVALFAEYGLEMSDAFVGGVTGLILATYAFITRAQVSPQPTPLTQG